MSAELDAGWQVVVDKWDDPDAHAKLLALVTQASAFSWAATQYKQRAGDPVADTQLERIRKAAIATMFVTSRRKEPAPPYQRTIMILGILIVMLVFGLVAVKLIHDTRP